MSYIVDRVPTPQEEFKVIKDVMGQTNRQMYETFNMGIGFVIYAPQSHREMIIQTAIGFGFPGAQEIGYVETGPRQVVIRPLRLEWSAEELGVR